MSELMSLTQLADYLQVKENTIYKWRLKKEGPPAVKVGRLLRFKKSDVDKWLAARTEVSTDNVFRF